MSVENKNLIKRIARLIKEKNDLLEQKETLLKQNDELSQQNDHYKKLLSRFSPESLNKEKKSTLEKHIKLKMVTVLFARISGWDKLNNGSSNAKVMDELDELNHRLEKITEKYNIRKLKTIGDTFMCAGGVPEKNMTNPVDVVLAAVEMQNLIHCKAESKNWQVPWSITIGIHTGPVSADVSGKRKQIYDLKGDTVNIATRVESIANKGEIFISITTNELIKEFFSCEYNCKIPVKYLGDLDLYKVISIIPELSESTFGKIPNSNFKTRFGLLQFTDIQELILDRLEKELPKFLYYHNVKHTVDVVTQVELIGLAEGVSDEELLLLKTAALFHDSGHIISYDEHEKHGCDLAKSYLVKYNYQKQHIDKICELIMATKMPPSPKNILEQIMCDADLDYLGRIDMIPVSNTLFKELKEQNKIDTLNEWNKLQLKFISSHQYFTKTARNLREVNKQKQIHRIKELIS